MQNTWTRGNYYYVSLKNKSNSEIKAIINRMGDNAEYVHARGEVVAIRKPIVTNTTK